MTLSANECPGHDIKQSDGEALVMLGFWGMWGTPSLQSLSGYLTQSGSTWKSPLHGSNRMV